MKKGSAVALPSGTRYGAHVAPQRCTILRNGKAVISYHIRGVFYPLKFKIVLDMGYTSDYFNLSVSVQSLPVSSKYYFEGMCYA